MWKKLLKVEFTGGMDEEMVTIKCQCGREIHVYPYQSLPGTCSKCNREYYYERNIQVFMREK